MFFRTDTLLERQGFLRDHGTFYKYLSPAQKRHVIVSRKSVATTQSALAAIVAAREAHTERSAVVLQREPASELESCAGSA